MSKRYTQNAIPDLSCKACLSTPENYTRVKKLSTESSEIQGCTFFSKRRFSIYNPENNPQVYQGLGCKIRDGPIYNPENYTKLSAGKTGGGNNIKDLLVEVLFREQLSGEHPHIGEFLYPVRVICHSGSKKISLYIYIYVKIIYIYIYIYIST